MSGAAKRATSTVENSRALDAFARVGYAANGLLHGLIGGIALSVALGHGGEADQSGALGELAHNPAGTLVLWIVAIGLTSLGLWQILHAFLIPGRNPERKWAHRLGEFGKAVAYLFVAAAAFTFALGSSTHSAKSSKSLSAHLLSTPGGVFVLVAVGLLVFAIGVAFIVLGVTRRFLKPVRVPEGSLGRAVTVLGVIGYLAKGIVLAVVGILFCVASATFDPAKATGLDGALKQLAQLPFGAPILVAVGLGLIVYGVYCLFRSALARL